MYAWCLRMISDLQPSGVDYSKIIGLPSGWTLGMKLRHYA
jgi:hypothetical protein